MKEGIWNGSNPIQTGLNVLEKAREWYQEQLRIVAEKHQQVTKNIITVSFNQFRCHWTVFWMWERHASTWKWQKHCINFNGFFPTRKDENLYQPISITSIIPLIMLRVVKTCHYFAPTSSIQNLISARQALWCTDTQNSENYLLNFCFKHIVLVISKKFRNYRKFVFRCLISQKATIVNQVKE